MTELRIGYFLEDIAHEKFFVAMVEKVAGEFDFQVIHNVRNARGGKPKALGELKQFFQDLNKGYLKPDWDILIVAIDANSEQWSRRKQKIEQEARRAPVPCLVVAVPSPYIQAWFLLDAAALSQAFEVPVSIEWVRRGKKVDFKDTFNRTARKTLGFPTQYEVYGDDIARHMDLAIQTEAEYLSEPCSSFRAFIRDLRKCLAILCPQRN